MTETEAINRAKETLRAMRYREDGSGYLWIDDTDYNLVMHPILPEQEGNNRYELEDQNGVMIIQEIMKAAQAGGGYNSFSSLAIMIVIAVIVVLALTVFLSLTYGNRICQPLKQLEAMATSLSDGDMTTHIQVTRKDELGATASALDIAQNHFVELISAISSVTNNLSSAEVESLDKNANDMRDFSQKSLDTLRHLLQTNQKNMDDIVSMQKQTNLLALNASIERSSLNWFPTLTIWSTRWI